MTLTAEHKQDLIERGFSRRHFGRIAAIVSAGMTAVPMFTEQAYAQLSKVKGMPPDAVKINANENPLGPGPEAVEAIHNVVKMGGRYTYELTDEFRKRSPRSRACPPITCCRLRVRACLCTRRRSRLLPRPVRGSPGTPATNPARAPRNLSARK